MKDKILFPRCRDMNVLHSSVYRDKAEPALGSIVSVQFSGVKQIFTEAIIDHIV
jgi:hypothetical protein